MAGDARRRLAGGIVAGPVFLGVWLVQALTREGFDPARHPISLLSLGDWGWVQVANFVLSGALVVAAATALRRPRWLPLLIGGFGLGLVLAGVFPTDAGAGFPPGAPAGAPEQISWHGALHEAAFGLAQLCWVALSLALAWRSWRQGARRWAAGSIGALVAVLALVAWPDPDGFSLRLVAATAVELALLTAVIARERAVRPVRRRDQRATAAGSGPGQAGATSARTASSG